KDQLAELKAIDEMINVIGIRQKKALGLGHAVGMAEKLVGPDEWFAVLLGDDLVDSDVPCIGQLAKVHEKTGKAVVAVMKAPKSEVSKYGVVGGEAMGKGLTRVKVMVEKPKKDAPSDLAVIGRYILPPRVFELLRRTREGAGGEIQLTDALNALAAEDGVIACEFEGKRYDAGDKVGYLEANLAWAMKDPELRDPVRAICRRFADGKS